MGSDLVARVVGAFEDITDGRVVDASEVLTVDEESDLHLLPLEAGWCSGRDRRHVRSSRFQGRRSWCIHDRYGSQGRAWDP